MARLLPARLQAALSGEATRRLDVPGDLLGESRHRVRFAATLGALSYLLFLLVQWTRIERASGLEFALDRTHNLAGALLCAALIAAASAPALGDRAVLRAALAAEVLLSILISTLVPWASYVRTGHLQGLTWVVPLMILFALLVPLPGRVTFAVSALCGATMPLGPFVLARLGRIEVAAPDLLASCLTAAVGVAIATLAARVVYGAGRQVAAARRLGSYELVEPIGRGGMGEVWKARHLLLARPAAVKRVLPDTLRGPREERAAVIERFTREARVTASLRSPHTVELFDFGVSADGTLYYAMELLEGLNVEHFVYRFGPVEPRRAVRWLVQACHSLGEAHARGLVHRDVKPANLFLCRFGRDTDFVKVLDFGLTRPVAEAPEGGLTGSGVILGTPAYLSPEQVFGLPVEPRTDLYALGCVGYWLLAGERPFESDSAGELLRHHATSPPPPLSTRARRPVPAGLESALMRCLAKAPADRPRDADALAAELAASVEGGPWSDAEAKAWWDEHLPAPAAGAGLESGPNPAPSPRS